MLTFSFSNEGGVIMTLKELRIGESGIIQAVGGEGALRQHLLDMGVIPGAEVTVIKYAPLGDPIEIKIHGYELTLRLDDAARIDIEKTEHINDQSKKRSDEIRNTEHPGLGEGGKFHPKGSGDPLLIRTLWSRIFRGSIQCRRTAVRRSFQGILS